MINVKVVFVIIAITCTCRVSDILGKAYIKGTNDFDVLDLEVMMLEIKLSNELLKLKKSMQNQDTRSEEWKEHEYNRTQEDLPIFDVRVDEFPDKCHTNTVATTCAEATVCTKRSGIYELQIEQFNGSVPFLVECDVATADGDWVVIQRRQDGSVDFFRNWPDCQKGFGHIDGEFFIGLDRLYALTNFQGPQELLVIVENRQGIRKFAKYTNFAIGNEADQYALKTLGRYSGTLGDSLDYHMGAKWTTKDKDNDQNPDVNCAQNLKAAWWYKACFNSNLNGLYGSNIYWKTFSGGYNETLSFVQMMIRRRRGHKLVGPENIDQIEV